MDGINSRMAVLFTSPDPGSSRIPENKTDHLSAILNLESKMLKIVTS